MSTSWTFHEQGQQRIDIGQGYLSHSRSVLKNGVDGLGEAADYPKQLNQRHQVWVVWVLIFEAQELHGDIPNNLSAVESVSPEKRGDVHSSHLIFWDHKGLA